MLKASTQGYIQQEIDLYTPSNTGIINQELFLEASPKIIEGNLGSILALQAIYFRFDDVHISQKAEIELIKVAETMKMYPEIKIQIETHADARGSYAYNMELSEKRAQATREWLIKQGVSPDRITTKAYGKTQIINNCEDGVECSELEHLQNRRANFIIK